MPSDGISSHCLWQGELKSTCPTQSFSCPKKLIKITKTRE